MHTIFKGRGVSIGDADVCWWVAKVVVIPVDAGVVVDGGGALNLAFLAVGAASASSTVAGVDEGSGCA